MIFKNYNDSANIKYLSTEIDYSIFYSKLKKYEYMYRYILIYLSIRNERTTSSLFELLCILFIKSSWIIKCLYQFSANIEKKR